MRCGAESSGPFAHLTGNQAKRLLKSGVAPHRAIGSKYDLGPSS
jgi:hypothetical protein